jgi:xanthine dehydrogenase large subunit
MVGIERVMDHVAFVVGREPLEVRKANFYREMETADASGGDISAKMKGQGSGAEVDLTSRGAAAPVGSHEVPSDGRVQTTPYMMPVEDFIGHELVAELERTSDYRARKAEIARWNAGSPVLKRGIALTPVKFGISFTLTWLNQAGALVHVYQDGSVALNHGGTEMGQGLFQKVAQVTASVFGLDVGMVKITATDTGKVPNTSATAASSGSDLNGMAAKAAAETIRGRLAEFIAEKHQVKPSSVRFVDGTVRVAGEVYDWARVVAWAYQARVSLSSTGYYATPKIIWDRVKGVGRPFYYFAYGAAVTEVVIDRLTGENRILRADLLHDTGTSLNPALDIGQVEGAYVQGAGWLTTEELVWDGKGRLATHAPSTYKIPACSDRPRDFRVALWGKPNREDAVGKSKAVGEPPFMLGISAFYALSDAVAACGDGSVYPALDAPATAERVLMAVRRVEGRV